MGFGPLFIGFMFLYDFQLGLRHDGAQEAWAMLDMFPDLIGWILIFFGLRTLSKKAEGYKEVRAFSLFLLVLSVFTLAKDTLLYTSFYVDNVQSFAGEAVDFCVHLLELSFVVMLFRKTAVLCRKKGEDKLSASHATVPRIAMAEGLLFILARTARLLSLPESLAVVTNVVSMLDFLFTVFLVWYGAIALFRGMLRITE